MFSTFHVPSTDETTRFDDLWFERERNKFFFETKTGASEDHRCGWFINFSFKLAVWIFKKKKSKLRFSKILLEKKKQMVPQRVPFWLDILITTCTPLYSYGPKNRSSAGRL